MKKDIPIVKMNNMDSINDRLLYLDPSTTIIFFDIDNTLLRTTTDIGSVEWIKWQEKMIHDSNTDHPYRIAKTLHELYHFYQKWLITSNCETDLLENHTAELVNSYAKMGFKIVLITARNKDTWQTTLDQLSRHYDISQFFAGELTLETPKNIYRSGVYFATGMDKGICIKFLLHLYKLTFDYEPNQIVFVDDSMDECQKVASQFAFEKTNVDIFCYKQSSKYEEVFNQADKDELHKKWIEFCN